MDQSQQKPKSFHELLMRVIGAPFLDGESHCYFSTPPDLKMHYPCYVYHREPDNVRYADNTKYVKYDRYQIILITEDPDDPLVDKTSDEIPNCRFDRFYIADGLNHYAYTAYTKLKRIIEEENEDVQN